MWLPVGLSCGHCFCKQCVFHAVGITDHSWLGPMQQVGMQSEEQVSIHHGSRHSDRAHPSAHTRFRVCEGVGGRGDLLMREVAGRRLRGG